MFTQEVNQSLQQWKGYVNGLDIGIEKINDDELLSTVFVHKSYAADYTQDMSFNERLEFLGDGILGAIVNKLLFLRYKDAPESKLTLYKIGLVREETLAEVAREIGLGEQILLGRGEKKQLGADKDSILSDGLEALLGFLYLDSGVSIVENFIVKYIFPKLDKISERDGKSYKSLVQEYVQKEFKILPVYKTTPDQTDEGGNVISYKAEVFINNALRGSGSAKNKKKAQEEAAKDAYELKIK